MLLPMEPVAPSTVSERRAGARARIGRGNGAPKRFLPCLDAVIAPSQTPNSSARAGRVRIDGERERAAATAAATMLSMRSMKPPWPGIRSLASLSVEQALERRTRQVAGLRDERQADADQGEPHWPSFRHQHGEQRPRRRRRRPTRRSSPAQVLLGDMRGHSFGPPMLRPAAKAAVSDGQTTTKMKSTAVKPNGSSLRSQSRATAGRPT